MHFTMFKNLRNQLNIFNKRYNTLLKGKICYTRALVSWLYCAIRHAASADDFFRYRFIEKSDYQRSKFITYGRSQYIIRHFNNTGRTDIFNDKCKFNDFFAPIVKRAWICTATLDEQAVKDFVNLHGQVIAKPQNGGQGKGIFLLSDKQLCTSMLNSVIGGGYLLEELIKQHPLLASINKDSVNTVRIVTFYHDSHVHIISCALRTGLKGSITDNLHSEASQCWVVDPATGIVCSPSFGYDFQSSIFHRGSNTKVIGLSIPNWDLAVDMVKKAAMMIPDVAYIGWDVAIMENDVQLIEGNHDPGHDLMQMGDDKGKYELIKHIIKHGGN